MCLTTKSIRLSGAPLTKKVLEAIHFKRARKDIVVWKRLRRIKKIYTSPFQNFEYKRNVLYTSKLRTLIYRNRLEVHEGLHAYVKNNNGYKKFKMIIPKGSTYILGVNGNIVSNQLIWKN